ncbi:hypothetical protein FHG87_003168 [Trinorchestia longiramus]|nr:hypothetical protein FHG87_003168 [Trinorchestia longiramus]
MFHSSASHLGAKGSKRGVSYQIPNLFKWLSHWLVFREFQRSWDPDFNMEDFKQGVSQAVVRVTELVQAREWGELKGLLRQSIIDDFRLIRGPYNQEIVHVMPLSMEDIEYVHIDGIRLQQVVEEKYCDLAVVVYAYKAEPDFKRDTYLTIGLRLMSSSCTQISPQLHTWCTAFLDHTSPPGGDAVCQLVIEATCCTMHHLLMLSINWSFPGPYTNSCWKSYLTTNFKEECLQLCAVEFLSVTILIFNLSRNRVVVVAVPQPPAAQAASITQEARHRHGVLPKLCYGWPQRNYFRRRWLTGEKLWDAILLYVCVLDGIEGRYEVPSQTLALKSNGGWSPNKERLSEEAEPFCKLEAGGQHLTCMDGDCTVLF